ncbi:hypothetical protein J4N45_09995 [Vibrio sp. SCSIO 43140]|uniref:hypothetical protein n=1 Tax=Vibrio sp. SCSIO 43140 TaxID=2819100 RepID=UPI002075DC1E|nr:hypothetical protein [Vibrio sp. SCSIO 43140]USD58860.1 hypothetical protein J4N45_09995 [Vibrio sp. SCSIO 43140]
MLSTLDFDMYHCKQGSSDKVWGIYASGDDTYAVYGPRSAKKLNFYRKNHANPQQAFKYVVDTTRKKEAKGYTFTCKRVFKESELSFSQP